MDEDDREELIGEFPLLKNDSKFVVSSPKTPNYNCIAYAYLLYTDRWMQPSVGDPILDAITWWPDGVENGFNISALVEAFEKVGYKICDNADFETGYTKVALYYTPEDNCWTHAARQSRTGDYWMSKMGEGHDIKHGDPYFLEGDCYGKVYCIMSKHD
ncbi:MAG: hypothetical protein K6G31_07600 [Paludibacteraceae bacterium]|nr:hypothetical protein [Paludibacteraceae bacterium]